MILVVLAVFACVLCLVLTPVVRNVFLRLGFVDYPSGNRKIHTRPVPRVGGVPILVSSAAACTLLFLIPPQISEIARDQISLLLRIVPAVAVIFLTGLVDDLRGLRAGTKFIAEVAAGLMAFAAGVRVSSVAGYPIHPVLGLIVTICWLVACTNAINLIDGLDGLASGVGLFASVTMLISGLLHDNFLLALATAPLAGSLLGFLRYNFNPASIFLGDSGSLFLGFVLGCYGVIWTQKCATLLGVAAPLLALSVPLLDTTLAIARRYLRLQPIFDADRDHIHHRLLARGFSPRHAALLLYAACAIAAAFSLTIEATGGRKEIVVVLVCLAAWIAVRMLGYVEFGVAGKMLRHRAFRRMLQAQLALRTLEGELDAAATPDECWRAIRDAGRTFGFCRVSLRLCGRNYEDNNAAVAAAGCWNLRVPLSEVDYVEFARDINSPMHTMVAAPLVDLVGAALRARIERARPPHEPGRDVDRELAAGAGSHS